MPQMSPMLWLLNMLYFIMMFYIIINLIYYMISYKFKLNNKNKIVEMKIFKIMWL